ncbi:hypothetical protein [Saccharothrix longispora]|uniref:hypothetical protein n=1 Tax=Saccharothrix longispora TaxID=33920 RepID=UPI0028FD45BD|nr:hypothetical protein [Saccharothrix longispora]MDU0291425.1 hypothetical protein [Saccharothrix longispora]
MTKDDLLDQVMAAEPRMFALYGAFRREPAITFVGWGVQLAGLDKAYLWGSTGTHIAHSAEQIAEAHRAFGDTELVWLDQPSLTTTGPVPRPGVSDVRDQVV